MRVHGSCHCGALTWEGEADPARVSVCHCADCQTLSGAAFRASVPVRAESFVLRGEPVRYVKTAENGNRREQGFCGQCGSPVYSADAENPQSYNLRTGGLRERADLPPRRQIWCQSALPWSADLLDVPDMARQ